MKKVVAAAALVVLMGVGGCSSISVKVLEPEQPERQSIKPAEKTVEYQPGASAAVNEAFFAKVTKEYAESESPLEGEPLVNYYAERGFDKGAMQVTGDRTKINLEVDSMFIAVRIEHECLIAQFETGDRSYQVARIATVGPNKDLCLIGNTRYIDW
ncbi:hypothetical protein KJY78_02730 [Canibacter sp. lx-45]|uniref:DUF6993 domain-containing protein n=1 Tax=Canibacter zhuwentaonis TaxID=2837491 RepID=UPI001BDD3652|nr:hypothetical protein [Canibacter zhuwentaonis]MBT1035270.1 hypothetical protein [Canibacter zhuwentaonis]